LSYTRNHVRNAHQARRAESKSYRNLRQSTTRKDVLLYAISTYFNFSSRRVLAGTADAPPGEWKPRRKWEV